MTPNERQDVFIRRVRKIYEEIDETTNEANYEFFSEQDMVDANWSESLGSMIWLSIHKCVYLKQTPR